MFQSARAACRAKTAQEAAQGRRIEAGCPNANPTSCVCTPHGQTIYNCPNPSTTLWASTGKKCVKADPDKDADWNKWSGGWDYPADFWNHCPPPVGSSTGSPSGFNYWIEPGSYHC